jgi:hypothetical protein
MLLAFVAQGAFEAPLELAGAPDVLVTMQQGAVALARAVVREQGVPVVVQFASELPVVQQEHLDARDVRGLVHG